MRNQRFNLALLAIAVTALSACVTGDYDGGRATENVANKPLSDDSLTPDSTLAETWSRTERIDTPLSGKERDRGLGDPLGDDDG